MPPGCNGSLLGTAVPLCRTSRAQSGECERGVNCEPVLELSLGLHERSTPEERFPIQIGPKRGEGGTGEPRQPLLLLAGSERKQAGREPIDQLGKAVDRTLGGSAGPGSAAGDVDDTRAQREAPAGSDDLTLDQTPRSDFTGDPHGIVPPKIGRCTELLESRPRARCVGRRDGGSRYRRAWSRAGPPYPLAGSRARNRHR